MAKKVCFFMLALLVFRPAWGQDKSSDILLVHAAMEQTGETSGDTSYSYSADATLKYIAEYLWGMLEATDGFRDAQVDYDSEMYAHSLADIYYDPMHADLKAQIGSGYRFVILFDSDLVYTYPEILYEGCKQLSEVALEAGSTPMLMMASSDLVGPITLGEYAYRAANGCGVEVIPGTYAMKNAGMQKDQSAENVARQAWIAACTIYRKITGFDPADTGYTPTYVKFDYYVNETYGYDSRWPIDSADLVSLTSYANEAVAEQATNMHYNTSYELSGSVVYRSIDLSVSPLLNDIDFFYKGSSTHEFTADRMGTIVKSSVNAPLSSSIHFLGNQLFDTRNWTTNDLAIRTGTFSTYANQGLLLFVGHSDEGAYAQDIIDSNQSNLVPMVFDWIKGFDSASGTTSTINALNNQHCADLWMDYYYRGWKTIPLTVALGRLNEKLTNFIASDDALHLSDPVLYMNASMMLTSALGTELAVPPAMTIRRGDWTQAELETAVLTGQEVIKELAFMSETSAYVPDSDLTIATTSLPDLPVHGSYSVQLSSTGGTGGTYWEMISGTELPDGLSLSANGLIYGTVSEIGTWSVAFKVTDSVGAFRKVGFTLASGSAEAADITVVLSSYAVASIVLPDDESGNLTYSCTAPTNGTLTGTAPNLIYTPNAGIEGDRFTYTITSDDVTSDEKTVTILVVLPDGQSAGAPEATSATAEVDEDGSVAIALSGFDAEGDALTARIISGPSNGSLGTLVNNVVTYEPDLNFSGSDSFTFKMNDGALDSAEATISITVNPVNDTLPLVEDMDKIVTQDTSLPITLLGSDADGDSLTYTIVAGPIHGTLDISAIPDVIYTPNEGVTGSDSFTYTVNDGFTNSAQGTVSIQVTPKGMRSILYTFETPANIAGTTNNIVYTAPDSNTFGDGVTVSSLELSDLDDPTEHYGRIENLGGGSVEAAVTDRGGNTVSFTVTIDDTVTVDLTTLSFDTAFRFTLTGNSTVTWDFATSVGGVSGNETSGGFTHDGGDNYQSPAAASGTIALAGLTNLTDTAVTFTWTLDSSRANVFGVAALGLDDIELNGTVITENEPETESGTESAISVNFYVTDASAPLDHQLTGSQSAGLDGNTIWNNINVGVPSGNAGAMIFEDTVLSDDSGNATAATLKSTLTTGTEGTWFIGYAASQATTGGELNLADMTDDNLFNSYLGLSEDDHFVLNVSGLGSGFTANGYSLIIYSDSDRRNTTSSNVRQSLFTVTPSGDLPVSAFVEDDDGATAVNKFDGTYVLSDNFDDGYDYSNYTVISNLTASSFTLAVTSPDGGRGAISGFQIVANPAAVEAVADLEGTVVSGGTHVVLSWTATSRQNYSVMATTNLMTGSWIELTNEVAGSDGELTVTNAVAGAQQFFRIDLKK
jgi:hypothetical protein